MTRRAGLSLLLCLGSALAPATPAQSPVIHMAQKRTAITMHARGTFEVTVAPLPDDQKVEGLALGRHSIAKRFAGDVEGTSKGEMMSVGTSVEGSAGYVAIERVSGTLKGRAGTFLLLHQGTMKQGGDFNLSVVVIPDSGTEQLTGLSGKMTIIIAVGKHSYEFDYTLPDTR